MYNWIQLVRDRVNRRLPTLAGQPMLPRIVVRRCVEHWTICLLKWLIARSVLTYEFLVGHPPFESKTKETTYQRITTLDIRFPSHVSESAQDFIRKLLVLNPHDRMPLSEVKNHPWIKKYEHYSLTQSMFLVCLSRGILLYLELSKWVVEYCNHFESTDSNMVFTSL